MKKALFIIDVQKCYVGFTLKNQEDFLERINMLVSQAKLQGIHIYYFKHYYDHPFVKFFFNHFLKGFGVRGNNASEFCEQLNIVSKNVFEKNTPSAFLSTSVQLSLEKYNIDEIYFAGLDGSFCVAATAKAALANGYAVSLILPAVYSILPCVWKHSINQIKKHPKCHLIERLNL